MGKSRNSKFYRDMDDFERDRQIKQKDKHRTRKAKQNERDRRFDRTDDDGPYFNEDQY